MRLPPRCRALSVQYVTFPACLQLATEQVRCMSHCAGIVPGFGHTALKTSPVPDPLVSAVCNADASQLEAALQRARGLSRSCAEVPRALRSSLCTEG